jgi:hypothetical protein
VYAFDPLSPEFATDLVRKTARIVEGMDWVMRPGGIATPEGLSAAVRAGMQHLAAHQGDVRAALASVKAAGATADDDNLAPPAARPPWPDPMWREGLPGEVSTPTATAGNLEYDLLDPGGLFLNNRHGGNEGLSPGVQLAAFYVVSPPTERSHDPYVIPAAGTKNPLEPIPGAVGPHSTFRRAPDGPIHHYETYEENPKTGTFERVLRYRGTGKEHGKVRTPYVMEPSPGKGPGSPPKVARPALPHEIPGTVTPAPTQASPPPQQAVPPTTSPPESTPTGPDVPETDIPDGVML